MMKDGSYEEDARQDPKPNSNSTPLSVLIHDRQEFSPSDIQTLQRALVVLIPIWIAQNPFIFIHAHLSCPRSAGLVLTISQYAINDLAQSYSGRITQYLRICISTYSAIWIRWTHSDSA